MTIFGKIKRFFGGRVSGTADDLGKALSPSEQKLVDIYTDVLRDAKNNSAPGLCQQAIKYAQAKQHEIALTLFKEAVALDPNYGWGWSDLGICLLEMDRLSEAESALLRASTLIPDDILTLAKLGEAYARQRMFTDAERCLNRCQRLGPGDRMTAYLSKLLSSTEG